MARFLSSVSTLSGERSDTLPPPARGRSDGLPPPARGYTYKLVCEYDGTLYHGWQTQPNRPTLQGTLERAIAVITRSAPSLMGAGRTDAGVHATAQTAHFHLAHEMDPKTLLRGINALLPPDIAVTQIERVAASFHARHSAVRKTYCYSIYNGATRSPHVRRTAWFIPRPLALTKMRSAALHLQGRHDFTSLVAAEHNASSCLLDLEQIRISKQGAMICFTLVASHFLRYMVRNIVGLLVDVGRGHRSVSDIPRVLEGKDRRLAGPTAPPHGLCLIRVDYE